MPTPYASRLANTAIGQYNDFRFFDENDAPLFQQIRRYWTGLGLSFPGVGTAWSAVFVSWCVKQAGANSNEFSFSPRHAVYVRQAIRNQQAGTGVFRGHDILSYAPQVGDIIQNNRNGNTFDFNFARTHSAYESHCAIVVERGSDGQGEYAMTVGGNESDSIRRKRVVLNSAGFIQQRTSNPFICVIQTLK